MVQALCSKDYQISTTKVAILTPYSAQKIVMQRELKKHNIDVKVATISESQGNTKLQYN